MNINLVCVGKLKEKYWSDACGEYIKRLGAYCNVGVSEIKETRLTGDGQKSEAAVKEGEGRDILARIDGLTGGRSCAGSTKSGATGGGKSNAFVIALDVRGKKLSSEALAEKLDCLALEGKSDIIFIIGGSLGLSQSVLDRADYRLSFSDMTFPHQMMRVILLEQIYRAYKINRGETYHK